MKQISFSFSQNYLYKLYLFNIFPVLDENKGEESSVLFVGSKNAVSFTHIYFKLFAATIYFVHLAFQIMISYKKFHF